MQANTFLVLPMKLLFSFGYHRHTNTKVLVLDLKGKLVNNRNTNTYKVVLKVNKSYTKHKWTDIRAVL